MPAKTISKRIAEMRAAKGLSASELARRVGCSSTAVAGWEGGSVPRQKILAKLASVLDVSEDYLLTGKTTASKLTLNTASQIVTKAEADVAVAMGYEPGRIRLRIELLDPLAA